MTISDRFTCVVACDLVPPLDAQNVVLLFFLGQASVGVRLIQCRHKSRVTLVL